MFKSSKELYFLLNKTQKKYLWYLFIIVTASSFFEIISVGSIVYFVSYLSNQNLSSNNIIDNFILVISQYFELNIITSVSLLVLISLLISTTFLVFGHFFNSYFNSKIVNGISEDLFKHYISRSFLEHIKEDSSKIINNLNSIVYRLHLEILNPMVIILSRLMFSLPLIFGMLIYNFKITLIGLVSFILVYLLIFKKFKNISKKNGSLNTSFSENKIKLIKDMVGLFKDININNLSEKYLLKFKSLNKIHLKVNYTNSLITLSPKNIIEFTAFSLIIFLVLILNHNNLFNFNEFVSTVSVFIICIYKLLPSFQQIYNNLITVKFGLNAYEYLKNDLHNAQKFQIDIHKRIDKPKIDETKQNLKIDYQSSIKLKNIFFSYDNSEDTSLKKINLEFKIGEKVAIFGPSGAGKTTLINILSGLIHPSGGSIFIDGKQLEKKMLNDYKKNISLVPQEIYLTNETIESNISLYNNNQDSKKIKKIIEISQLASISDDLKKRNMTSVGDTGAFLSGGQKQRVAIARALFKGSKLIIFDEATNSLDEQTEYEIIRSFEEHFSKKSIILITHNPKILNFFDKVVYLQGGEVNFYGSYESFKDFFKSSNNKL